MGAELGPNRYGKAGIHVATVVRREDRHDVFDRVVDVRLEGDFEAAHIDGDNATVLPTDTMRGSVLALCKDRPDDEVEAFALRYTAYLLDASPAATKVHAWVTQRPSPRGPPRRTPPGTRGREEVRLAAGIEGLSILKTTGSAFSGFLRDRFTTLP